jgi:hypothetical protein
MTARLLTLAAVAWLAVTIASFGALVQACRYVELGEADA